MFDSFGEFRDYAEENSHLEFVYLWLDGRWIFSDWTTTTSGIGRYTEWHTSFNGFHELIPAYVREGWKLVNRYRDIALEDNRDTAEYAELAYDLEERVTRWNEIGVSNVAREYMAA